ncbi:nucleotide-diphospho-sugar transferase [Echria macrotheca]|uniref:Nucleotide-diphospho-sugar transferase n=1 Tax=Echria macrotheca TaxID=438768 RepID=A0AAJ0BDS1_9PEZI|nr:nucleotide-diphospho-sugar transferase [Echria macrotheca]
MSEKFEKLDFETTWKAAVAPSSPGSPSSPLSPKIGTFKAKLRNRIPTQMRRTLPLYLVCLAVFLLVLYADVLGIAKARPIIIQRSGPQTHLAFAHGPPDAFPKKIWQTWKVDPYNFAQRDFDTAKTWTSKNPGYRYEVLTDDNDMLFVEEKFGPNGFNRPDIVEMYRAINLTIIKADLLRYMIMYAEGGVYADIDVEALRPVSRFVPARYKVSDIDMVIGVEIDQPEFRDHPILGKKSMSFCQWTFMCKPQLPVMLRLIENIMAWISDVAAKQNVPISDVVLDFDEVISGTGPSAFTAAVINEMNVGNTGEMITWDRFHAMDESQVVSRVLVLTVEAFAAGQGHSDSGNHNSRGALVKHHFHASNWPSKHPRFSHPAYGEVERCNWVAECIRDWDRNVEEYKTLTPEQQQRKIAIWEAEQKRQLEELARAKEKAEQLERLGLEEKKREEESRKRLEEEIQAIEAFGSPGPAPDQEAPKAVDKLVLDQEVPKVVDKNRVVRRN